MTARALGRVFAAVALLTAASPRPARAVTTAFTFQGQLRQGAAAANGPCDFQFGLFDALDGGTQVGTTFAVSTTVSNGLFSVGLDFGAAAFTGPDRWLQIAVRCPSGTGEFTALTPRQALTPAPYAIFSPVVVRNPGGAVRASMELLDTGGGFMRTFGPNGNLNTLISSIGGSPDLGFIGVYDELGQERASLQIIANGGDGLVRTRGPNGNTNVRIASLLNFPNNGFVTVDDEDGEIRAGMYVNQAGEGIVFGDMKNFAVDHPNRPGTKITYSSLEGPEAAIYHRGRVQLVDGRAVIDLPEHFCALAQPDTITVQLTPGSLASRGLAFGAIQDGRIEIGELQNGRGTYDVHFVVHAVRRGYEDFKPVLSTEEFRARYGAFSSDEGPARDVRQTASR
jgi:hypothetical protein